MIKCSCGGYLRRHQIDETRTRLMGVPVCRYYCKKCGKWERLADNDDSRKPHDRMRDFAIQPVAVA